MRRLSASVILLDAGDTLVRPASGSWSIPLRFAEIISSAGCAVPSMEMLRNGMARGHAYLDANHHVQTTAEETRQFTEFFRLMLEEVCPPPAIGPLSISLARDWVENHAKYVLFDDVPVVLPRLRRQGYTLGVLSNTYPSLEAAFQALGLRELFRVFLISSKLGVVKPAPRIFAYAIERLGVAPGEILLVDDVAENIEAATAAGLQGVQIARYDAHPSSGMWIRDLYELEKLLTAEQ